MEPKTVTTGRLPRAPGVNTRSDVISTLIALSPKPKPPHWEPRWADAGECLRAAKALRIANYATVSSALSSTPSPADDVRVVRNYFAHRSEKTAKAAALIPTKYGLRVQAHPDAIAIAFVAPGMMLLELWVAQFLSLADAAIQ